MTKISLSITLSLLLLSNLNAENSTESIEQSGNITITTANQSSDSIANTTADISVVTASEIEESGDQTVAQAISRVAGISVVGNGGFGQPSSIFMRGQAAGGVLILLDGMRLNDPSSTDGRAMLENLMTDNIAQIEIIKGGASSIWGSNASAGVINIITKGVTKKGFGGSISVDGGSYNTKGANALISYGSDKLTAQIMASYLDSDSFSALSPRDAENDYYTNRSYNAKLGYKINDNNRVDLAYYYIDADGDYDDSFSTALADDTYSHYTATQENISLKYRYSSESFSSSNTVSQGTYERDYYTNSYGEAQNQYRSTIKEISSINSYSYEQGKAILGLEAKDIDGMNNYISSMPATPSQSVYKNRAIFLSNSYNFKNDTLLETNLRYDNFDEFDNKVTYKIGVRHNYDFLKGFATRANYYTAYSSPSAYQLANTALGELLKPSYSNGFDISANYKELLYITYFHTEVEDNIDYDMDRFGYYNVGGKEKFSGVEVSSKYKIASLGLVLGANLTHLITYESFDTTALSTRAKDTANLSVDYFTANGMHFGTTGQYIGDRVDVSEANTGNYTVWNLNFDMEIMKDLKLYVNAKNILDKEYESVYGYATEGRAIYAKLRYKF